MAKQKFINGFPETLVKKWENNDGVDFAIALSRISGWLIHVDWWANEDNDKLEEKFMKSIRVYVGLDENLIFDFTGKKRVSPWVDYIINPIVFKRKLPKRGVYGGVRTRYYSEEKLMKLPLRVRPSDRGIKEANDAILNNEAFLSLIPPRLNPEIPAHVAAQYTYGWCAVFADALKDLSKLPATAIIVTKYIKEIGGNLGFCHSVVVHPDGEVEDAWGKQSLQKVLDKFGIEEFSLSVDEHNRVSKNLSQKSPAKYEECYDQARFYLLSKYSSS